MLTALCALPTSHSHTLYIANKNYSSWSLRPWVLMKECGIPFEEKIFYFDDNFDFAKAASAFSPTGKVPCLHSRTDSGDQILWESLGITEYLAEQFPHVWPADAQARAWARCAASEMHSGFTHLRHTCSMNVGLRIQLHDMSAELQSDLTRLEALWHEGLHRFGGPFLAGDSFTAVDAFFVPVAFRIQTYQLALSPTSMQYVERLLHLPSVKEWEACALVETPREKEHEAWALNSGKLLADLRKNPST